MSQGRDTRFTEKLRSDEMRADIFDTLAKHYDSMMSHIDYERWLVVSTMIAELCPNEDFEHLDAGCGTGALVQKLREHRWRSYGGDLSNAMVATGRKRDGELPLFQCDITSLPFGRRFHFLTCVFDTLNFLVDEKKFEKAFHSMREVMTDDGVVYFDVITEQMVMEHYADRDWVDTLGRSKARWHGVYNAKKRVIENTIWIDGGAPSVVRERVYDVDEIRSAAEAAGLTVLGVLDTETWCEPTEETLRLDIVASVRDDESIQARFREIRDDIQGLLEEGS